MPGFGTLALPLYALAALVACANYSTSSGLVGGIRSVAVPAAENETAEERVAEILSERISEAFTVDGRLRVVDEESADALLLLRLVALEDRPFDWTTEEVTEQYRFRVWIEAELVRTSDESSLLDLESLEGWGTYDAAVPDEDEEGRDPAVEAGLDMVIEEIVDRTTASW